MYMPNKIVFNRQGAAAARWRNYKMLMLHKNFVRTHES